MSVTPLPDSIQHVTLIRDGQPITRFLPFLSLKLEDAQGFNLQDGRGILKREKRKPSRVKFILFLMSVFSVMRTLERDEMNFSLDSNNH